MKYQKATRTAANVACFESHAKLSPADVSRRAAMVAAEGLGAVVPAPVVAVRVRGGLRGRRRGRGAACRPPAPPSGQRVGGSSRNDTSLTLPGCAGSWAMSMV